MFRRSQICPGPSVCPYVLVYGVEEPPPCSECPEEKLTEYLRSPAGHLIQAAIDLDFALQAGVTVTLRDIRYPDFLLLRILTEERNRFQEEEMRKATQSPPMMRRIGKP